MTTTATPLLRPVLALATALLLVGCGDAEGPRGGAGTEGVSEPGLTAPAATSAAATSSAADDDLSDFPLAAGWPERPGEPGEAGVVLPVDDSEPDVLRGFVRAACGTDAPEPGADAVLRGRYADVEDYRSRSLLVFPDADAAVAYVAALRSSLRDCEEQSGDSFTYPVVAVATEVGGESFGTVIFTESDGSPAVGLQAQHVVRVGRSVLVEAVSNEGGAGSDDRGVEARRQVDQMIADAADVVAAQCAFTEKGC